MKRTLTVLSALLLLNHSQAAEFDVVARHKAVFMKPPERIPSRMHPDDAPILGNGDLTVAFAGKPEYPQFWIASNDFWEFRAPDRGGAPKALGRLIFEASAMEGASYRVEQDFLTVFCIKSLSLVAPPAQGGVHEAAGENSVANASGRRADSR